MSDEWIDHGPLMRFRADDPSVRPDSAWEAAWQLDAHLTEEDDDRPVPDFAW
jgi:hypothetical protein